jgi:small-conductance mechanosensitive channel
VKKAIFVATEAALAVDRLLLDPQPLCHVTGFNDSSIDMDLRLWIKDPENGMANLKGAVYLASTVYIVFFLLLDQCHQ